MANLTESDWQCMRGLHDEMLAALCSRINQAAAKLIRAKAGGDHATYLRLYKHILDSDEVVAECFNDWRRSTIGLRLISLRRHKVMTEEQFERLTPGAREMVNAMLEIYRYRWDQSRPRRAVYGLCWGGTP